MKIQYLILPAVLLYASTCVAVPATLTISGTSNLNSDTGKPSSDKENIVLSEPQANDAVTAELRSNDDVLARSENKPGYNDYSDILRPLKDDIAFPAQEKSNVPAENNINNENDAGRSPTSTNDDHNDDDPVATKTSANGCSRPHILMIVADDLGWNDVSWRDKTMYTPELTKLASEGVILNQAYVQPVCSPSRAAFMSGYYPYHLGLQHESLRATQKAYLPGNVTTLPQHLQKLGYKTHMAGKWHLGFCNWRYTPTYRGFDTFVGFYNAIQDYYTHIGHHKGYDFRRNKDVYWEANGTYSAFIFTKYIEQVIADHDPSQPLFVYLPYQSVHGPLQVPKQYIDKYCSHIQNATRRTHCGMTAALDEGVGNITRALKAKGLYDDTILLFTTDNGGPVHESSNNWPLRGSKATLWEGGTRGTAFLHGPKFFKNSGQSYDGMIHAVDWMPTLVEAAGGPQLSGLDGVSQWQSILQAKVPSARTEFVYNFDEMKKNSAIRQGKYKLLEGKPGNPDGWYPPPTMDTADVERHNRQYGSAASPRTVNYRIQEETSYMSLVTDEVTLGDAVRLADLFESAVMNSTDTDKYSLHLSATRRTSQSDVIVRMTSQDGEDKKKNEYQLYDLEADPYEHHDIKDKFPDVLEKMVALMENYRKSLVPANFPPHDPDALPKNFGGTWSPGWC